MAEVKGVLVPNITFFKADGSLDPERNRWHMNWLLDNGVNGLFVTGSYGSGPLMSNDERIEQFKLAKEAVEAHPGSYWIAHVGCADTANTVALAREAEKIGCDAIGAVPPFYYAHSEDKIIAYYKAIIDAVSLPVFAYNNPGTSRFTFTFDTVQKLQKLGLKGVKDSTMNVTFLTRVYYDAKINKKDFKTIIGTSNGWLPFCRMGIDTMIAGMCNYAPEIVVAMYKYTLDPAMSEKADEAYLIMQNYLAKMRFTDSTIISHMALKARGFDCGYPRLPMSLPDFSDPKYAQMTEEFNEAIRQMKELEAR